VRRAKLYYLRDRVGRGARVRERRFTAEEAESFEEGAMPPPEVDEAVIAGEIEDPRDEGVEEVIEQETAEAEAEEKPEAAAEQPAAEADEQPPAEADEQPPAEAEQQPAAEDEAAETDERPEA